jgi:hypothetical protein
MGHGDLMSVPCLAIDQFGFDCAPASGVAQVDALRVGWVVDLAVARLVCLV